MDPILHYTSVNHAGALMSGINKMRVNSDLCDVTVLVGDYRILAHKIILSASSPFFYQMFKIDTRSALSNPNEIALDSVDEIAALKIIEFCYTSAISLDDDTVWPLLEAAIKFQFAEICSLCCEFLTAGLDISNCILSLRLAARLRFFQLEENCVRFLVDNLQKASQSQDLVSLSAQELSSILSLLEVHGTQLHTMATLTQAWLNWDRNSRADFVPKLKLLLPILGEVVQSYIHDGTNIVLEKDGSQLEDYKAPQSAEEIDKKIKQGSLLHESSTFSITESTTGATMNINMIGHPGNVNTGNSLNSKGKTDVLMKSRDFICVCCGDEFECNEDLIAHSHLCDESVHIVNSVEMKDQGSNSINNASNKMGNNAEGQDKIEQSTSQVSIGSRALRSSGVSIENESETFDEPSYPKTRRSLRNRKIDVKVPNSFNENSTSDARDNSLLEIQGDNTSTAVDRLVKSKERENKNSGEGPDGDDAEIHSGSTTTNGSKFEEEMTTSEHTVNINDDNNNDVLSQEPGRSTLLVNFISKSDASPLCSGESNGRSTSLNSDSCKKEKLPSNEDCEIDDTGDSKGSSTLRQWRQEHQSVSSNNINIKNDLAESSPKHKCLICSRGFWDRKTLANHWRQNHGVSSVTNDEGELSCSDNENEQNSSDMPNRKSPVQSQSILPNNDSFMDNGSFKSHPGFDMTENVDHTRSHAHNTNTDLNTGFSTNQSARQMLRTQKIKEEVVDDKVDLTSIDTFAKYKNYPESAFKPKVLESEQHQPSLKQFESASMDHSRPLNPSVEQWMRGAFWSPQNPEGIPPGVDLNAIAKASQNLDPAASEYLSSYIKQYNKLAEWCIAQGAQFCPLCMGYHTQGKPCPKAVGQDVGAASNNNSTRSERSAKDRDTEITRGGDSEERPLDMSKSSIDLSYGQMTPSSSKSSSLSSSGHSSLLGASPFFNYSHLMPTNSDALDMSSKYGDNKMAMHNQGSDATLPFRKSPLDPNSSFGTPFSPFHPQFSTAPSLSSQGAAGPSNNAGPNTSTPMSALPAKSSTLPKKKVTSNQGFPCTVCNRVFSYQTALFTHMHTHSPSTRSYRCQLCNETFARAPDLKVHVCPNGLEKPYSCPSCGQTFAKNIHLKRHLATHSGLKPYPCWVCGKRFSRSDHLKRHTQSIHAGARPHVCQICGKEFVRKYELNKHVQSHEQSFVVSK